jgi:hypothetical protein
MKKDYLGVVGSMANRQDVDLQAGTASFGERMGVRDEGRIYFLELAFQCHGDRVSTVAHSTEPKDGGEEILLEEIGLVERQAIGRANIRAERQARGWRFVFAAGPRMRSRRSAPPTSTSTEPALGSQAKQGR